MKKLLFTLVAAILVFSGCNKTNQFKVTLNLDNADNQTAYLYKDVDGQQVLVDSAIITDKTAVLKADADDPQTAYLVRFEKNETCGTFTFFSENQNTTISGDIDAREQWTVKAGPAMEVYDAYRQTLQPMEEQIMTYFNDLNESAMAGDTVKAAELYVKWNDAMEAYKQCQIDFFKSHPDHFVAHFLLYQNREEYEMDEVKEAAACFTTETHYSQLLNAFLEKYGHFLDFTLKTAEGNDIHLAEVIQNNTVTLVDFWASWCGPCRGENPNVKAAYEKYHEKGLEIIGVSVDQEEAAWMKAVEEDGLPWIHVRDTDHSVGSEYLVKYIPSNFLYNQNGELLAKNLRGEELEAKLAEVLK